MIYELARSLQFNTESIHRVKVYFLETDRCRTLSTTAESIVNPYDDGS